MLLVSPEWVRYLTETMKPSADWTTPAPYRFRVISEDHLSDNPPFIIEYYVGSILGGSWKTLRRVPDRPYRFWNLREAEQFISLFEEENPAVLDFHLAIQKHPS